MKRAFYAGILASLAAGAVMLLLRATTGALSLPEALVDATTRFIPLRLLSAATESMGQWAKRGLGIGLVVALIAAGGLVAMACLRSGMGRPDSRRRWPTGVAFGIVLWFLAMVIVLPLSRRGVFALSVQPWPAALVLSWLASSLAYSLALTALAGWGLRLSVQPEAGRQRDEGRRAFIRALGWTVAGVVVAAGLGVTVWKLLSKVPSRVLASLSGLMMTPEVTPVEDFYHVSKDLADPQVDAGSWSLIVDGLVATPLKLGYDDLKKIGVVEQYLTLECISNPIGGNLIGNARWTGVRLSDVLARAGVRDGVRKVVLHASDGYADSITPAKAMEPGTLLAYQMDGAPLLQRHGFPVRVLVPGIYGMKNVKWLSRIELVDYDFQGYWQQDGWSDTAVIDTMSRIDVPQPGDYALSAGTIGGVAFAGTRGISRVEVSTDGGKTWADAQTTPSLSPYSWTLWTYDWAPASEGSYRIFVRATDGTGAVQTAENRVPLPDGATGYHDMVVELHRPA